MMLEDTLTVSLPQILSTKYDERNVTGRGSNTFFKASFI